jgi:hypothetical protein
MKHRSKPTANSLFLAIAGISLCGGFALPCFANPICEQSVSQPTTSQASVTEPTRRPPRFRPTRRGVVSFLAITILGIAVSPSEEAIAADAFAKETEWCLSLAQNTHRWSDLSQDTQTRLDTFLEAQGLQTVSDQAKWREQSLNLLTERHLLKASLGFRKDGPTYRLVFPPQFEAKEKWNTWVTSIEESEFVQAVLHISERVGASWTETQHWIDVGFLVPLAELNLTHPDWIGTERGAAWLEVRQNALIQKIARTFPTSQKK